MGQGLSFSLAFVATNALIVDLAPPGALGRAIAVFGTTTLGTHAIGPTLGEWILEHFGFPALAWTSATAALVACVVFSSVPEPRTTHEKAPASPGLVALAVRRGAWGALVGAVGSALAFGAAMNFIPVFVRSRALHSFAPFFVAYVVAAVLVRLVAGGLGDRVGHRAVAGCSLVVFAVSVAALGLVSSSTVLAGIGFFFGATHGWVYPSLNALFLHDVPPSRRGRAMALFNLAFNGGVTVAAFVGGEIAERHGYSTLWLVAGACAGAGVLGLTVDRPSLLAGD
jgi:MFS family permease